MGRHLRNGATSAELKHATTGPATLVSMGHTSSSAKLKRQRGNHLELMKGDKCQDAQTRMRTQYNDGRGRTAGQLTHRIREGAARRRRACTPGFEPLQNRLQVCGVGQATRVHAS